MDNLKKCCNRIPVIIEHVYMGGNTSVEIQCQRCKASTGYMRTVKKAIDAWNGRENADGRRLDRRG